GFESPSGKIQPRSAVRVGLKRVGHGNEHGSTTWRGYGLAFADKDALAFIVLGVGEGEPELAGTALAILKSVSLKTAAGEPTGEKGKSTGARSRGLEGLFSKSGAPQAEKPSSWDPPIFDAEAKPSRPEATATGPERPTAGKQSLSALFPGQGAAPGAAAQTLRPPLTPAPSAPPSQTPTPTPSGPIFPGPQPTGTPQPTGPPQPTPTPTPTPDVSALNDPIAPDVDQLIKKGCQDWLNAPAVPPYQNVPGWPNFDGGDFSFQYPPDWTIVASSAYHLWVSDRRAYDHFLFVEIQRIEEDYSIERLGPALFKMFSKGAPMRILATEQKNPLAEWGVQGDEGKMQLWYIRWLHPQAGKMLAALHVCVLKRTAGFYVMAQWALSSCPEAEAVRTTQEIFTPLVHSGRFAVPGPGPHPQDSDHDGYPDDQDAAPNDPNVH
ncbi:MAG: hypothetical protein NTW86_23200, partial [Candidatus Sumerlaeota bacterium]|nr:hypothetical protein [Candidatus Sumerlaeota bacterium]